jgi:hypothetical protein
MRNLFIVLVLFLSLQKANGQTWRIQLNTNEAFILGNDLKGQYPALWYNKNYGFMAGGFGLGVSFTENLKERHKIKYHLNVVRQRYFDEPYLVTDAVGSSIFGSLGINTNYNIISNVTIQSSLGLNPNWLFGVGLGIRANLISRSDYGELVSSGVDVGGVFKNLSTSKLVLILPIEVSYQWRKFSLALRPELDVTRSSNLPKFKTERFLTVNFEVGYIIGNSNDENETN